MIRVIVTGGRSYSDRRHVWASLWLVHQAQCVSCIIQGGADGADRLARQWALFYRIEVETHEADWPGLGRGAGPVRNEKMASEARADLCIWFPGGTGTADMCRRAKAHGIPLQGFAKVTL